MDLPASDVAPTTITAFPSRQNLDLASGSMPFRRSSEASSIPRRLISDMTKEATSLRWMKRQSEQFQTGFPRLPGVFEPRSSSPHG